MIQHTDLLVKMLLFLVLQSSATYECARFDGLVKFNTSKISH